MATSIKILLAFIFVITSGSLFRNLFEGNRILTAFAAIIAVLSAYILFDGIFNGTTRTTEIIMPAPEGVSSDLGNNRDLEEGDGNSDIANRNVPTLDSSREDPDRGAVVELTDRTARNDQLAELIDQAANLRSQPSANLLAALAETLRGLGQLNEDELTPEQAAAVAAAREARAAIDASDERTAQLRAMADSWQRDRQTVSEDDLVRILGAMTDLDRERFAPADEQALTVLDRARRILEAPVLLSFAGTRDGVPISLELSGFGAASVLCQAQGEQFLRANGYKLATDDATATISLVVETDIVRQAPESYSSDYQGARTVAQLSAYWAYDDEIFFETSVEGHGVGSDDDAALLLAHRRSIDRLFIAFDEFVTNQMREDQ